MRTIGTLFGHMLVGLLAAAFVAVCVLWARSHAAPDVLAFVTDVSGHERRRAGVESHDGWVLLWDWNVTVLDLPGRPATTRPTRLRGPVRLTSYPSGNDAPGLPSDMRRRLGIHTSERMLPPTKDWAYRVTTRAAAFPYWPVALLTGALPAAALARRLRRGARGISGAVRNLRRLGVQVVAGAITFLLCAAVAGSAATLGGGSFGVTRERQHSGGPGDSLAFTGVVTVGFRDGRLLWYADGRSSASSTESPGPSRSTLTNELSVGDADLKPDAADAVRLEVLNLSARHARQSLTGQGRAWTTGIAIPGWVAVVLLGGLVALRLVPLARAHRRAARRRLGLCEACGYDLRASVGACPECGTPRPTSAESSSR